MIKKVIIFFVGACLLALGAVCEADAKDITFNFDSLPSAQGFGYESISGVSENNIFSISGGVLHQHSMGIGFSGSDHQYYIINNTVDPSLPFTVTLRARVTNEGTMTSDPSYINHYGFCFGVGNGTENSSMAIGTSTIEVYDKKVIPFDNTQYHTYSIMGTPGLDTKYYVDGVLIMTSHPWSYGENRIFFGDGSGGSNASADISFFEFSQPTAPTTVQSRDIVVSLNQDTNKAILLNGEDAGGANVSFSIVSTPAHGTVSVSGAIATYIPMAGYIGADTFTFKANNGTVDSNIATAWITVASTGSNLPPDVRLLKTFTVNGSSTAMLYNYDGFDYYYRTARFGGSLKADTIGNLYMAYGNDKDLRYAYLDNTTKLWSDTSIEMRSKGRKQEPRITKTSKGTYVLSSESNWNAIYDSSSDSSLFFLDKDKAPGSAWTKLADVYADRLWEGYGPANIVQYMFPDPQGNIHIQLMHEGWWSYGYAQYEQIFNAADNTLGPETGISTFPSSTGPDTTKNYTFLKTDTFLGNNQELLVPLYDHEVNSVIMAKSLPPYGSWTRQTGFYQNQGIVSGLAVTADGNGIIHSLYEDSSKNLYYSYNWGPAEKINSAANWSGMVSDIIVKNGKVYVIYTEQDLPNMYYDRYLNLISKDVGGTTWSQPVKIAHETGYYTDYNGWKLLHFDKLGFAKSIEYNQEPGAIYIYYEVMDGTINGNSYLNSHIKVMKVDLTSVAPLSSISGTVTTNGSGLGGVTIALSGAASQTTTTAQDGTYSFTGLSKGDYAITPTLAWYTFTPPSLQVTASGVDVNGEKFAAVTIPKYTVTVKRNGTGTGVVTSSLGGINCGSICNDTFQSGQVTLKAVPDEGSLFSGWNGGGCSGYGDCTININSDVTVNAGFYSKTVKTPDELLKCLDMSKSGINGRLFEIPIKGDNGQLKLSGMTLTAFLRVKADGYNDSMTYGDNTVLSHAIAFNIPDKYTNVSICVQISNYDQFQGVYTKIIDICDEIDPAKKLAANSILAKKSLSETYTTYNNYNDYYNNFHNPTEEIDDISIGSTIDGGLVTTDRIVDFDRIVGTDINTAWKNSGYQPGSDNDRIPLLLIHGWQGDKTALDTDPASRKPSQLMLWENSELKYWQNFIDFYLTSTALQQKYHLYLYKYPSYKHIPYNANKLKELLTALPDGNLLKTAFQSQQMLIIGHSMGGLVARSFIEEFKGLGVSAERLIKLITLDTPHHGSPLSLDYWPNNVPKDLATPGAGDLQWDAMDQVKQFTFFFDNVTIDENNNGKRWKRDGNNLQTFDNHYWSMLSGQSQDTYNPWLLYLNKSFESINNSAEFDKKYIIYSAWNVHAGFNPFDVIKSYGSPAISAITAYDLFNNMPSLDLINNERMDITTGVLGSLGYSGGGAGPVASSLLTLNNISGMDTAKNNALPNSQIIFYSDDYSDNYKHPFKIPYRIFWDYDHSKIFEGAHSDGCDVGCWDKYINAPLTFSQSTDPDTAFNNKTSDYLRGRYINRALQIRNKHQLSFLSPSLNINPLVFEPVFMVLENDLVDKLPTYTLDVVKIGTGTGTVNVWDITCGNACSTEVDAGKAVTLTAVPDAGSAFVGWTGTGCAGKGACTVKMNKPLTVTAEFAGQPKVSGAIANKGLQASGILYIDLKLTDTGAGNARNLKINGMTFSALTGTGSVTYNKALSQSLPLTVGDLSAGASTTARFYLNVPATVKRFSITESGTVQDVIGTNSAYQIGQTVFP